MRNALLFCLLFFGGGGQRSISPVPETAVAIAIKIKADDSPLTPGTVILVRRTEFYLAEPTASVLSKPLAAGVSPTASRFMVRAWKEGDYGYTRIVVYAAVSDGRSRTGEIETPIATSVMRVGQSNTITETGAWKAAPVLVSALPGSVLH